MQTYENFTDEITSLCNDNKLDDVEVQNEIVRVLDYYYNLSTIQLLILIPAILVRTQRENSLEFSIVVINGWVELTTRNFTIKLS